MRDLFKRLYGNWLVILLLLLFFYYCTEISLWSMAAQCNKVKILVVKKCTLYMTKNNKNRLPRRRSAGTNLFCREVGGTYRCGCWCYVTGGRILHGNISKTVNISVHHHQFCCHMALLQWMPTKIHDHLAVAACCLVEDSLAFLAEATTWKFQDRFPEVLPRALFKV